MMMCERFKRQMETFLQDTSDSNVFGGVLEAIYFRRYLMLYSNSYTDYSNEDDNYDDNDDYENNDNNITTK